MSPAETENEGLHEQTGSFFQKKEVLVYAGLYC